MWINPTPQSVRFCRSLRIVLEKEDNEATIRENNRLNVEIKQLIQHRFKLPNNQFVNIKFNVYKTLLDGKCLNVIVGNNASSRCPVCKRSAYNFKNLNDDLPRTISG